MPPVMADADRARCGSDDRGAWPRRGRLVLTRFQRARTDIERDAVLLVREGEGRRPPVARAGPQRLPAQPTLAAAAVGERVIAIGSSTGGVEALFSPAARAARELPAGADRPAHARRLHAQLRGAAERRMPAHGGSDRRRAGGAGNRLYCSWGERHMELRGGVLAAHVRLRDGDLVCGHRPSVDVLFNSVAPLGKAAVGVILTGMGADGARGHAGDGAAGARTLGQSRETCVVWGMPRSAKEVGAVEQEVGLSGMPEAILKACRGEDWERLMPAAAAIKVMVVDDQTSMRAMIRRALQDLGFKDVRDKPSAREALAGDQERPRASDHLGL